jgi:hypothetical protein
MSEIELSEQAFRLAQKPAELEVFLAAHPEVKVDLYKDADGSTSLMHASNAPRLTTSVRMLLDHNADTNARSSAGLTSLIDACLGRADETTLVLLERGADVNFKNIHGVDALYYGIWTREDKCMAMVLMCCGTDAKNILINQYVTQARVDAAIADYKNTQAYIEQYHELLTTALSDEAQVDTRMGRGDAGINQEPMERTLEYLGLSMNPDQVVNTSIDGTTPARVLIPHQPRNAKHWHEKYEAWTIQQQNQQQ